MKNDTSSSQEHVNWNKPLLKADCQRCGGCGELDAGAAPCPACGGRGYFSVPAMLISVDLYERLSKDIAAAIGLSTVYAPDLRDRLLKSSAELDDAFYALGDAQ